MTEISAGKATQWQATQQIVRFKMTGQPAASRVGESISGDQFQTKAIFFSVLPSSGIDHFVASIGEFLYRVTEPALRPIRRFIPDLGGIDISPIILLLIIFFLQRFLATTIAPALL